MRGRKPRQVTLNWGVIFKRLPADRYRVIVPKDGWLCTWVSGAGEGYCPAGSIPTHFGRVPNKEENVAILADHRYTAVTDVKGADATTRVRPAQAINHSKRAKVFALNAGGDTGRRARWPGPT